MAKRFGTRAALMIRRAATIFLVALAATASARCPSGATLDTWLAPGRHGAGVRTLELVDASRSTPAWGALPAASSRTLETEVWYPADVSAAAPVRDAALAHGRPFPLVVYAHGYGLAGTDAAYLGEALATRGYVVAAPTFPLTNGAFLFAPGGGDLADLRGQVGDVGFVIDEILALARGDGWLTGGIDRRRIAVAGLSLGGLTTLLATFDPAHRDRRVRAAVLYAPVGCFLTGAFYGFAHPPLLVLGGDEDLLAPLAENAARVFERAVRSPRRLATLAHATHVGFAGAFVAPSPTSYDALVCAAVADDLTPAAFDGMIAALGPETAPYVDAAQCTPPCLGAPPPTPPMPGSRQHDIARAATVAFLEATFRRSRAGQCVLDRGLDAEADVTVERARRGTRRTRQERRSGGG